MPLISEEDRTFLVDYFSREIKDPVQIAYFTQYQSPLAIPTHQECMYCKETKDLLQEVADLSDKIELKVYDFLANKEEAAQYGVDKIPATVITGKAKGKVRFYGIPSGYEFGSIIEGIVDIAKGVTDLSDATKASLSKITQPVHIQVFVTPT